MARWSLTNKLEVHFGDIVDVKGSANTGGQEVCLTSGLDVEGDLVGNITDGSERDKDARCSSLGCLCTGLL